MRALAQNSEFSPTRIRKGVYADATINLKKDTLTFVPAKYQAYEGFEGFFTLMELKSKRNWIPGNRNRNRIIIVDFGFG